MADDKKPAPKPRPFSSKARKAKDNAIQGFKDEVTNEVIKHWGQLHGEDQIALNRANVEKEVYDLTHPAPDPKTGEKPKYNYKFGNDKPIPSEDTMEEFGNAAARSVDKGTQTFGMSWLNTIVVAIQAFFTWITGGADSFTDAFAKITTKDITREFDKETKKLENDPEHKQFMEANNIKQIGKEKIASAVKREAGLDKTPIPEAFDIDKAIAENPVKFSKITSESVKGATPEQTINNAVNAAIDGTKAIYDSDIKALDKDNKKTFDELEVKLREQAKALATAIKDNPASAPATPDVYADTVIKKTIEGMDPEGRRKFGISDELMQKSVPEIVESLKTPGNDQQQIGAGLLLGTLRTNLTSSYIAMREDLGVKVTPEEQQAAEQKAKQGKLTDAQGKVQTIGDSISSTIKAGLVDGVKEATAIKVYSASWTNGGGNAKVGEYLKDAYTEQANGIYSKKDGTRVPTRAEKVMGIDENYDYAVSKGRILNQAQLNLVAKTAGEVTREYMDSLAKDGKPIPDKLLLGPQLEKKLLARLTDTNNPPKDENGKTLDDLGDYKIAEINKKNGKINGKDFDVLATVAKGFGDAISENKASTDVKGEKVIEGAYSQLVTARDQLVTANKEVTKATADLNPSSAPKLPSKTVENPAEAKAASHSSSATTTTEEHAR